MLIASACGPKMCPLQPEGRNDAGCTARMQHYHGGELYRGLPWWRKQHLRVGEKYKKAPVRDPNKNLRRKPKRGFFYKWRKKKERYTSPDGN